MSEMIERVARAIQNSHGKSGHTFEDDARAAIEAMCSPTKDMVLAGLNCDAWANAEGSAVEMLSGTFTAMISAALKEPTP